MRLNRRQILIGSATIASAASIPVSAALPKARLTYFDSRLAKEDVRRAESLATGVTWSIQPDLVHQWRGGMAREVTEHGAVCYVLWDKALLLAELAREHELASSITRLGRSMFAVTIA